MINWRKEYEREAKNATTYDHSITNIRVNKIYSLNTNNSKASQEFQVGNINIT